MSRDMRDIITRLLCEWLARYNALYPLDDDDYRQTEFDHRLDRYLMGVALFVKQVASEAEDMELLGFAAKIEMILAEAFEAKSRAREEAEEAEQHERLAAFDLQRQIGGICTLHFFNEPKFKVDLSKYREAIEANRAALQESGALPEIEKYLNETKILNRLYTRVSEAVYRKLARLRERRGPDFDDVRGEFDRELEEFYGRADKKLHKALREVPRLPDPELLVPQDAEEDEG